MCGSAAAVSSFLCRVSKCLLPLSGDSVINPLNKPGEHNFLKFGVVETTIDEVAVGAHSVNHGGLATTLDQDGCTDPLDPSTFWKGVFHIFVGSVHRRIVATVPPMEHSDCVTFEGFAKIMKDVVESFSTEVVLSDDGRFVDQISGDGVAADSLKKD